MESEGLIIHDGENYAAKEIGIKQIALEQYRRCAVEGSKNIFNDASQREIYINAVKSLEILLFPDILDDHHQEIKVRIALNEESITKLENSYIKRVQELKQTKKDKAINYGKLTFDYERRLVELMQEKLIILGLLLKKVNYYGEWSIDT